MRDFRLKMTQCVPWLPPIFLTYTHQVSQCQTTCQIASCLAHQPQVCCYRLLYQPKELQLKAGMLQAGHIELKQFLMSHSILAFYFQQQYHKSVILCKCISLDPMTNSQILIPKFQFLICFFFNQKKYSNSMAHLWYVQKNVQFGEFRIGCWIP